MISYLKGKAVEVNKSTSNRVILIIEVNGIGYEVQIPSRLARQLSKNDSESVQIHTVLQIREDRQILYGFETAAERDLFNQLIGVSGIGAQSAIALIDTLGFSDLVQAIVTSNIQTLSKTPGIGKKTAERIALELKTKLRQSRLISEAETPVSPALPKLEILEDVEMTLLALGYSKEEIEGAISAIATDNQLLKNPNAEDWIRSAITWLTVEA